jgi:hypothetical protein
MQAPCFKATGESSAEQAQTTVDCWEVDQVLLSEPALDLFELFFFSFFLRCYYYAFP